MDGNVALGLFVFMVVAIVFTVVKNKKISNGEREVTTMQGEKKCKKCGNNSYYKKMSPLRVVAAFLFFPIGLLFLAFPEKYCDSCNKLIR